MVDLALSNSTSYTLHRVPPLGSIFEPFLSPNNFLMYLIQSFDYKRMSLPLVIEASVTQIFFICPRS